MGGYRDAMLRSHHPVRPRHAALLGPWLLVATLAGPVRAEPPSAPERPPPLTALEAGELGRSSHVLLGTLVEHRDLRGPALARFAVTRWLKGFAAGQEPASREVTVLVGGPRNTTDKQRPSAAYLDRRPGTTYLLFLSAGASDAAFFLENRIEVRGLEGQEKVRAVEAQVALSAVADSEERGRRTLAHFLGALEGQGPWTRANAARELAYLGGVRPLLFTGPVRSRLRTARDGSSAPTVKRWLDVLLSRLPALGTESDRPMLSVPEPPVEPAAPPAPESPQGRIDALDRLLRSAGPTAPARALRLYQQEPDPEVQAWLVDWLADSGHAEALPSLRAAYASADAPCVREALVRATGLLGGDADLAWLEDRLLSPHLVDAALLALARLRTPAARAVLERLARRYATGTEEQRDLGTRIQVLLSPAFEDSDRMERGR